MPIGCRLVSLQYRFIQGVWLLFKPCLQGYFADDPTRNFLCFLDIRQYILIIPLYDTLARLFLSLNGVDYVLSADDRIVADGVMDGRLLAVSTEAQETRGGHATRAHFRSGSERGWNPHVAPSFQCPMLVIRGAIPPVSVQGTRKRRGGLTLTRPVMAWKIPTRPLPVEPGVDSLGSTVLYRTRRQHSHKTSRSC